jgi:16S rRNA (cytosine967-C5)-methyltransferase
VGETVQLAKGVHQGRAAGFVNAVLRSLSRDLHVPGPPPMSAGAAAHVAAAEALPPWIAEEWVEWLGQDEALALARAMNEPALLCLRSPRRDELAARLAAGGVHAAAAARSPDGVVVRGASVYHVARIADGIPFQVQDEAAQLVSLYAAGELRGRAARVLDACAAPGGKAFHLAELLAPGGEVVAVELHARKADELRREADRRGLKLRVVCADASQALPGLEEASFDAVLVDAPCAGLGTLRRHPELKLRRSRDDLDRMSELQRAIAARIARYARPGAPVTYAVCSLSRAEGPRVAEWLLAQGFRRAPAPEGFPADVLTADGDLLTLPHRHSMDGFYAVRVASAG